MMFLRNVLIQNRAEAADRTFQEDLPTNPLSHLLVTLRGELVAADTETTLADVLGLVTSLGVIHRGEEIVRGSLQDLAVLAACVSGWVPGGELPQDAAGDGFTITVPILLGRRPFNPEECFPASRRGELVLEMAVDVAVGNIDTLALQVETVELLEAKPTRHLKAVRGTKTFSGTGHETVSLPTGEPLAGILLWGTTVPTGAARTATWEQFRTLVGNREHGYARANWDSAHGEIFRRIAGPDTLLRPHRHRYNGAAGAYATSLQPERDGASSVLEHYAYVDFDPARDDAYLLANESQTDVVIQRDAGVADEGRYLPVQLPSVESGV